MKQQIQNKKIPKDWKQVVLKEILDYEQPNPYIITGEIQETGKTPVLTANKSFVKGYTEETKGIFDNVPAIIFDDFTADNKFVTFPFKVKSSAMKILRSKNKDADLKFIFYQMQLQKVNTTTHKRYYLSNYQNLTFSLPSIQEQDLIVQEIETQFTRLDEAVKSLKAVKEKLEVYRKAVLKKAFEGFKRTQIEKVVDMQSGVAFKKSEYSREGVRLFQIANVTFGRTVWDEIEHLPNDYINKYPQLVLKDSDVLMALNRPLLNHKLKVAMLSAKDVPSILYQRVGRFIFLRNEDKKFFLYYLSSPYFLEQLEKTLQGVNIPFINKSKLMKFNYPDVDKELQESISQEIETKFSVIDKIEQVVEASLEKAEKLRKSILKSAFEGKLVKMEGEIK